MYAHAMLRVLVITEASGCVAPVMRDLTIISELEDDAQQLAWQP